MRHIDRIQRYLDGEMSDDELKLFKDDLQKDPELVKELDLHRSIGDIILSKDEERFRKKLDEAYRAYKIKSFNRNENSLKSKKPRYKILLYGSAITLVLLSSVFYLINYGKLSNDALFKKYFISYNLEMESRAGVEKNEETKIIHKAIKLYEAKNYSEASQQLKSILNLQPKNTKALFYNGLCFIYLNEFENAIHSFEMVLNEPYSYFQSYAKWYLSMCYIKTNDNVTARNLLKEIEVENGYFSAKAKKVLKRLK